MENMIFNLICFVIVVAVCWLGIISYPKGTEGREGFVFVLVTSFIPYVAIFYVIGSFIIMIAVLIMYFITKLAGTD